MFQHGKKMVAPILITILYVIFYVCYFGILIAALHWMAALFLGIIPLAFVIIIIAVCIQRIKEIMEGEEDDLSKY